MAKPIPTPAPGLVITQQALNLVKQILAATGWAKSITEIYLGGQLLADGLPTIDPVDWVKPDVEVRAMTKAQRATYQKRDEEWATKSVALELTPKQIEVIKTAFTHFVSTGALGPNTYLSEIIRVFGFKVEE